jgi:RecA/RadA recombinase
MSELASKGLLGRLKKAGSLTSTQLTKSSLFKDKIEIPTSVPMVNVALSGKLDGGLTRGLTVLAGPSKHFKTAFGLLMAKAYMDKYPDSIVLFYDSEFGTPQNYFSSLKIDTDRVLHVPVKNVEELKFDLVKQLDALAVEDKVFIMIDSIGNLASKKEVEDSMNEKSVADMTRAKQLKSLFRMVTPYLTLRDVPLVAVNHTYETQEMFSKQVVSGGTGVMYSADNVWIIGRRQVKKDKDIQGYDFIINVEKSRFVKEKSKIPISVTWDGGIKKYSGLLDVALEAGFVVKPSMGWYSKVDMETGEISEKKVRQAETDQKAFWDGILEHKKFMDFVEKRYAIGSGLMDSIEEQNTHPDAVIILPPEAVEANE